MAATAGKNARLRRGERFIRADYRRVFAEGKSFPSHYFVAWILIPPNAQVVSSAVADEEVSIPQPHPSLPVAKLGVVVSRRTFPLAIQRNRAKRLLREAFRHSKVCIPDGVFILLIGRHNLINPSTTSRNVAHDLRRFLRKSGFDDPSPSLRESHAL